ncbi:MAG: ribonuclease E/G [Lachnospiraceae bacterium]
MNELVITGYKGNGISAFYEDGKMKQVSAFQPQSYSEIGNIYIGRIDNIVKNINAAFVNISDKCSCYLELDSVRNPLFVRRQSEKKISMGDMLLVQVVKEEVKTKAPVVTANFSLTGKYVVVVHGGEGIQVSKKIFQKSVKNELRARLTPFIGEQYGIVVRTNAQYATAEELEDELKQLLFEYQNLCETGIHQAAYTLLRQELPTYLIPIRELRLQHLDRIVTDYTDIYHEVEHYLSLYPSKNEQGGPTVLEYAEQSSDITTRYKINYYMDQALRRMIYLNSGATLVIDVAEALTAIDVNTGKAISGKKASQQTFFSINMEAAREIAYQLRLRNLSGIILVDFINLENPEHVQQLLDELRRLFKEDSVQTELVDITKLGLIEITRKKVYKTLAEQLEPKRNF